MRGTKKTISEYIIDALRTGQSLRAREISQMASDAAGIEIKIQDIAQASLPSSVMMINAILDISSKEKRLIAGMLTIW